MKTLVLVKINLNLHSNKDHMLKTYEDKDSPKLGVLFGQFKKPWCVRPHIFVKSICSLSISSASWEMEHFAESRPNRTGDTQKYLNHGHKSTVSSFCHSWAVQYPWLTLVMNWAWAKSSWETCSRKRLISMKINISFSIRQISHATKHLFDLCCILVA